MDLIGTQDWADFKSLFNNDVKDTFFNQPIIWRRQKTNVDRYGEDNSIGLTEDIILQCLINYNYLRSWPITKFTEQGETDEQSMQVLFLKDYLDKLGYLNSHNYFTYKPDFDRFILDGLICKPVGDSSVSQIPNGSLIVEVILVRQPTNTADIR